MKLKAPFFCFIIVIHCYIFVPAALGVDGVVDYEQLMKQCGYSDTCCQTSVKRMKAHKSILMEGIKCPERYIPNTLRCNTSFKWCEPYTGRCTAINSITGECVDWQKKPENMPSK